MVSAKQAETRKQSLHGVGSGVAKRIIIRKHVAKMENENNIRRVKLLGQSAYLFITFIYCPIAEALWAVYKNFKQ